MTSAPSAAACRLLLSQAAHRMLAPVLPALAKGAGSPALQVVELEAALEDTSLVADVAFVSRDITGRSSKTLLTQRLQDFYGVLRRSPSLAWVHTHSSGSDRPIYAELRERGVQVTTSSGTNAAIVAQAALGGVLALSRRFPQFWQAQQERRWAALAYGATLPPDLAGQTAVLVGWGPIAQVLQPWLAMLGLHTVVVRRQDAPAGLGLQTVPFTRLREVLPRADWLILACPLNDQTEGLIDAQTLACLRPSAFLVNVARGEVVDEPALIAALQQRQLAGAHLDVFALEPLDPASPLWTAPGVMITPHSAGHADGNAARVAALFLDNLGRWLRREPLHNLVS